jgi:hypothetical protein
VKAAVAAAVLAAILAGAASAAAPPRIRVRLANEMTRFYTEGFVWFAALDRTRPKRIEGNAVVLRAGPGRHLLRVFLRPCDANCSMLDPPDMRCSAVVPQGRRAVYRLRDEGCTITFD